jgi:hypothetical protein
MILDISKDTDPETALAIANLPEGIRGFGHVKAASIADVETLKRGILKTGQ